MREESNHSHRTTYNSQCRSATKFLYQWLPQSPVAAAFQAVCARVGVTQAWNLLQGQLGVPATGKNEARIASQPLFVIQGALNQATFQALLANTNQAALAQQLLTLGGVTLTFPGK